MVQRTVHLKARASRSRGVTLLFALITLAMLALAAVGLLRSVDTSSQIVGNLGLKSDALRYNDRATETAIAWIQGQTPGALGADSVVNGYYATSLDALDPTGTRTGMSGRALVDWENNDCSGAPSGTVCKEPKVVTVDSTNADRGITSAYVITRLCTGVGLATAVGNNCAVPTTSGAGASPIRNSLSYGDSLRAAGTSGQYYRIVVRTKGARNSIAFTESIVHF